jgi:hypothetical protein
MGVWTYGHEGMDLRSHLLSGKRFGLRLTLVLSLPGPGGWVRKGDRGHRRVFFAFASDIVASSAARAEKHRMAPDSLRSVTIIVRAA